MEMTKLTGRIITPDDAEYRKARINNNLSDPKFPKVIVFCQHAKDVVKSLSIVKK